jgi:hypothetical protein
MARVIEQFKRRPPAQQFSTAVLLAVSLGLVAVAERDIPAPTGRAGAR